MERILQFVELYPTGNTSKNLCRQFAAMIVGNLGLGEDLLETQKQICRFTFGDSRDLQEFWYETLHELKIAIEN